MSTQRDSSQIEITIKRLPRGQDRHGHLQPGWDYSWATPEDITWHFPDGTSRPGPRAGGYIEYGHRLADLRVMLRRKYGRAVRITETWKR